MSYWPWYRKDQQKILTELAKMFVMAPGGFNAILLLVKFGSRFTPEDGEALKLLRTFLGEEATNYMILLLTHGYQAEANARRKNVPVDKYLKAWIEAMEDWVKDFIHENLKDRVVLINNMLEPDKEPEAYKTQLRTLILGFHVTSPKF